MNWKLIWMMLLVVMLALSACTPATPTSPTDAYPSPDNDSQSTIVPTATEQGKMVEVGEGLISSNRDRISVEADAQDFQDLAQNINRFGNDLYKSLANNNQENLFFSPYSISQALSMTLAGAQGETESEMANVLHFDLPQGDLHNRLNGLDQSLYQVPDYLKDQEDAFQLNIANAVWGQTGYPFKAAYLDLLAESYGEGIHLLDFVNAAEKARLKINDWVAQETNQKIQDLIPAGAIDSLTRLVLTNAIYFNAAWQQEFNEDLTQPADFYLSDQQVASVDMMEQKNRFNYQFTEEFQMAEIFYLNSRYSMVLLMPRQTSLAEFSQTFDYDRYVEILYGVKSGEMILKMPKFEYESSFSAGSVLKSLGINTPFTASADFGGMYEEGAQPLFISDVIHKAYVSVDEQGTEAAAATAVIVGATSIQPEEDPIEMVFDHPFLFVIRDRQSGLILFMGNMVNPLD